MLAEFHQRRNRGHLGKDSRFLRKRDLVSKARHFAGPQVAAFNSPTRRSRLNSRATGNCGWTRRGSAPDVCERAKVDRPRFAEVCFVEVTLPTLPFQLVTNTGSSVPTGSRSPLGWSRRRLLNLSTQSSVANSTVSRFRYCSASTMLRSRGDLGRRGRKTLHGQDAIRQETLRQVAGCIARRGLLRSR